MRDPLDHFRDICTGPVYILGSGPSLRHLPSKLNGTVIAVNGSILSSKY